MFDKQYIFYGKYADMVNRLTGNLSDGIGRGIFKTNYDLYQIAPLVGYLYGRKSEIDKGDGQTAKIFRDKMLDEKDDLTFNYRNLMMAINKDKVQKEKMDIAFRMDEKDEERKQYDDIYNSYVLGGVEILHEKIFEGASSLDEYLMNLYNFLEEIQMRYYQKMEEGDFNEI